MNGKEKDVPFGWGTRMNAVLPPFMEANERESEARRAKLAAMLSAPAVLPVTSLSKPASTSVDLPFGWGARTNAVKPENEIHNDVVATTTANTTTATMPIPVRNRVEQNSHSRARPRILVGTRFHFNKQSSSQLDLLQFQRFVCCALEYGSGVAIAVDLAAQDEKLLSQACELLSAQMGAPIICVPVHPWGHFVPALNALVSVAVRDKFPLLCLQSLEVLPGAAGALRLADEITQDFDSTLVCGAAFDSAHHFHNGLNVLDGLSAPWNTLAMWNVRKLALTGFLLLAEGYPAQHEGDGGDTVLAGVEEVCTISVLQHLQPRKCRAKLLLHPELAFSWAKDFTDPLRQEWHKEKMLSKLNRASKQLEFMAIDPGVVEHIHIDS